MQLRRLRPCVTPPATSPLGKYEGGWTPALWRGEIVKALTNAFGAAGIDTGGKIAINIAEVSGSRPSADVVPSFLHCRYDDAAWLSKQQGSCVWSTDGTKIVNGPASS